MKIRRIWSNLAVADLQRTTKFYTELGFKPNDKHNSDELTSFLVGEDEFVIHFYIKNALEENMGTKMADLKKGGEVIFTLSAESREEVDQWIGVVKKAGGSIFSLPVNIHKGYTVGFSDPDGHKFNVLYWPGMA